MALQIVTWLLLFAVFYLLVTSVVFLRNRIDLTSLVSKPTLASTVKISVCIPARNEEKSIATLLRSLENQEGPEFEVHVLDDQSSDKTFEIAESYQKKYPGKFYAHKGEEKPVDWLGKPWACHQLSKKSDGEILLFLDADTQLQPNTLEKIAASFQKFNLDMLTVWPKQDLNSFWEKTVIPLVIYFLITHLPAIYVFRDPRWMPTVLRKFFSEKFAAANGQCIAFTRDAYHSINGHASVKNEVVEDIKMAQNLKADGGRLRMFNGIGSVSCRMYRNQKEMFEGFRKNFLAGFNYSLPLFVLAGLLHLIVFILPFVTIIFSFFYFVPVIFFLSAASISLIFLQRLLLALWYQMDPIYSLTHPIGVMWFQRLAIVNLWDCVTGKKPKWKGREV